MGHRQAYNPIGGIITTNSSEYQVIDTSKYGTEHFEKYREVYNLIFKNTGTSDLIFKVNKGEKMPLKPNQSFSCGDYKVTSLIIYTNAAKVQFSGFIGNEFKEV